MNWQHILEVLFQTLSIVSWLELRGVPLVKKLFAKTDAVHADVRAIATKESVPVMSDEDAARQADAEVSDFGPLIEKGLGILGPAITKPPQ